MKTIYRVLFQVDAYISESWFENYCFAEKESEERDGKEKLLDKFVVDKDFCKRNGICFSDSEHYTEEEWEVLESFGLED